MGGGGDGVGAHVGTKNFLIRFQAARIGQWYDQRANSAVKVFPACVKLVI
jgi:hypothetical protein